MIQYSSTSLSLYETHKKKGQAMKQVRLATCMKAFLFVHPLECGRLEKVERLQYSKMLSHMSEISDDLTVILSIPTICK